MSFYRQSRSLPERFRLVLAFFLQRSGLPFADALPEEAIERAFDDEDASFAEDQDAVYTPAVTLWAFLSQVLFKGEQRSCIAAVARVGVLLAALAAKGDSVIYNVGQIDRGYERIDERLRALGAEIERVESSAA